MRYRDGRRSVCLSSQSGCPLTCRFCATGAMRFARNLRRRRSSTRRCTSGASKPIDHCVFMGMGEPMLNLDAVLAACERLPDLGITHRRTTISTVGWIPGIEALADCGMPVRLALSLHAPEDALRSELMPVNERYPLADVLEACREFHARRRRRVFVEYVMLAGVNDRYEQALALAGRCRARGERTRALQGQPDPLQPRPRLRRFRAPSREAIAAFREALRDARRAGDGAAHARARHRRRLRPARAAAAAAPRAIARLGSASRLCGRPLPRHRAAARLAGAQQALAQLGLLLGRGVPAGDVGQLLERAQAEQLQELGRGAVEHARRTASGRPPRSGRGRAARRSPSRR